MRVEQDPAYQEGHVAAKAVLPHIEKTQYGSIDAAIAIKEAMIKEFEKSNQFAYSREMDVTHFDRNYAFNVGFLDELLEQKHGLL